jgi:predicted ATP-dependent endonuclease of OLD family
MTEQKPLTIISLDVQNVQRVRAVRIVPTGSTVILAGQNAQGKTSVLDAIEMALGGERHTSERPIRDGAKQASIVLNLGDLVIERVISKTGSTLVVRDADGVKQRAPQTILNELCSRISFDPLHFARMKADEQNELLRKLVGIDFTQSNREREALFNTRTKTGRDAKAVRAQSEGTVVPSDTPAGPVNVEQLMLQLRAAHATQGAVLNHRSRTELAEKAVTVAENEVATAKEALKRAESKLMAAKLQRGELARESPPAAVDPSDLERQIANAQAINRNVEKRNRRDELEAEANTLDAQVVELTQHIEAIDQQQREQLASVQYPVPGLSLGESGPLFKGVPLAQASGAERLRVSVGIGLALNPRLKVLLIRDASLLDEKSLGLVAEMAAEAGAQVWLERVGTGDPTAVIISDGQVLNSTAVNQQEAIPA